MQISISHTKCKMTALALERIYAFKFFQLAYLNIFKYKKLLFLLHSTKIPTKNTDLLT